MEPAVLTRATKEPDARSAAQNDRRLRAVYRRELLESVSLSALVVAVGIAVAGAITYLIEPSVAVPLTAVLAPLVLIGAGVARYVRSRGRRYVIPLGMLVGLLPMVSSAFSAALVPATEPIVHGSIGIMPVAFAVFIPLQRRYHLEWLVAANATFFGCLFVGGGNAWRPEVPALAFTALLALAFSLGANEFMLRRRSERDRQLLAVRSVYGRMKEHELDLRRQDEFLFMQQETLVVQQAELLRLNQELKTIARLDALTALGNRLRLNEDLAQMAARIERNGGTAGLLLMDLDRFKRLNDTQGHLAGDAALRAVAEVLRKTSRLGDGVYRYGGEEFLIILHDCDEAVLRLAGQRYLAAIQAIGVPHMENAPYGVVTASAGAAELSQRNCLDIDSALHDADEALYVAKEHGRNRLEVHVLDDKEAAPDDQQQRAAG